MTDLSHGTDENEAPSSDSLQKAAAQGPLPEVEHADEAERKGEEDSAVTDPEEQAEDAGRGDSVGGMNMR